MPKGVEHNDSFTTLLKALDLFSPLMPKGVEHNNRQMYIIMNGGCFPL